MYLPAPGKRFYTIVDDSLACKKGSRFIARLKGAASG
jgi:hypothetical protein